MAAATVFAQRIVVLFVLPTIAGSSDVIRVVGDSVQLEINGSVSEFDDFTWTFSESVIVLKYDKELKRIKHSPRYKDRVEFNEETCGLILKNLQKTDSGLYEVKASSAAHITTATYILSVFNPVEAPVLTLYNSADPCNITLTCRGHDLSINSSCYKETCEEKEVTSSGGVTLSLSVRDGVIICNSSNPASWKQEYKTFTHLCNDIEHRTDNLRSHWPGVLIAVCILGVLVILVVGYCWIKQRRSADSKQDVNTIYAGVNTSDQPSSRKEMMQMDSTVYSTVNPQHSASNGASGHSTDIKKPDPASVTVEPSKPESLYSVITKPSKAVSED